MTVVKLPVPEDGMSIEELVDIIALYRKELMFLLYNLDSENIKSLDGEVVDITNVGTEVSETIIVDTLYAERATIAELTVDQLKTANFVQKYKDSDTTDVNYLYIHEQNIEYINATTDGMNTEQLTDRNGDPLFWVDATETGITTDDTGLPVTIYQYEKFVKMKMKFEDISGVYEPVLTFGIGSGVGDNRKGFIWKDTDGLRFEYQDNVGQLNQIHITDDGISFANGSDSVTVGSGEFVVKSSPASKIHVTDSTPTSPSENDLWFKSNPGYLEVVDGITAPSSESGRAKIYVDESDSLLKIKFGNGTVKKFDLST